MSDKAYLTIEGLDKLEAQFNQLDSVMQGKVLRKVVKAAMQPVLAATVASYRTQWQGETGLLAESFRLRVKLPKKPTWADAIASVGVFRNRQAQEKAGRKLDPPVYAYWLEHGVEPHATGDGAKRGRDKKQGSGLQHPGFAARPFLRPAFDANLSRILQTEITLLNQLIDKALNHA